MFFCGQDGTITVQDQPAENFDPRLGKRLGGYVAAARVADGAMGRVFEGRHPETRERVAIKVLHGAVAKDPIAVARFKREFEAAQELPHAHIVKVLEFGETPDRSYFLTMEFLEGEELSKALRSGKPLAQARVVRIVCQAALALEHTHAFGYIHRDLKPDNIFLRKTTNGDDVRLLDFGSVKLQIETGQKLTAMGTTLGSPYYMSPEQAMGRADVDRQTDVFALGAVIYEMVTGRVAFEAPNIAKILVRIMKEDPQPPTLHNPLLPAAVDDVIARALAKRKEDRFSSVSELAGALAKAFGLRDGVEALAATAESEIAEAITAAGARDSATRPPPAADSFAAEAPVEPVATAVSESARAGQPSQEELAALAATAPSRGAVGGAPQVASSERPMEARGDSARPRGAMPGAAALRARLAGAAEASPASKAPTGEAVKPMESSASATAPSAFHAASSSAPGDWTPPTQTGFLRGLHPLVLIGIGMVLGGVLVALAMR